jgi:hypothetical protein
VGPLALVRIQRGQQRRFVVKTYVTATCAVEALRKARRMRPDDVYSLDDEKDGGGRSVDAVGFKVEPQAEDDE